MNTANAPEGGLSGTSQDLVILSSAMYEASRAKKKKTVLPAAGSMTARW